MHQAISTSKWLTTNINELKLLQSPLLAQVPNLIHAFTTRTGGQSKPPLDSFNLGGYWPNSRQDILDNRQKLCAELGIDYNRLAVPEQIHSANVGIIEANKQNNHLGIDALITDIKDTPMLVCYADCVPIILFDSETTSIAAIHAGWKGTASGIARNTVKLLKEKKNTDPSKIMAAIGPAIGSCCYPTDESVADQLKASVNNSQDLILWKDEKPHPDLKAINARQLQEEGVELIDICMLCTACHPELFYSHRQSKGSTGRNAAIACLKSP